MLLCFVLLAQYNQYFDILLGNPTHGFGEILPNSSHTIQMIQNQLFKQT